MPDTQKLLQAKLPEALNTAILEIDRRFDLPKELLQANVSSFENLSCSVFFYFDRDDVFYVNRAGRSLLRRVLPSLEQQSDKSPPIFWLEKDANLQAADDFVGERQLPLFETRELITLAWGKTWLHGSKFPIRALHGQTLALLFAGWEVTPSKQIRFVADHFSNQQRKFGEN